MEPKDEWVFFREIDWDCPKNNRFNVDTRDFHCGYFWDGDGHEDFDDELVGWLSATDSLDTLWNWFPKEDILILQEYGWFVFQFEAIETKFYERFQHWVINQKTSVPTKILKLNNDDTHSIIMFDNSLVM